MTKRELIDKMNMLAKDSDELKVATSDSCGAVYEVTNVYYDEDLDVVMLITEIRSEFDLSG